MEMLKKRGAAFMVAALMAGTLAMAGCGDDAAQAPSDSQGAAVQESSSSVATRAMVGTQAGASKAVVLADNLGADISQASVNVSGSEDEPTMLEIQGTWADGGEAMVFVPEANGEAESDLVLTAGKKEYVLHDVDFSEFDEADVQVEGKVAYLSYEADGQTVSTLEHEKELAEKAKADAEAAEAAAKAQEEAEAAAQAEAEAQAAAEAEAQAAAEEPVYEEPVYEEPVYEEPVAEEAPAQSGDQCVEGGVQLR